MTSHWHNVIVNKMSTLLKLRPTNTGDIVMTFSFGNQCIQTFHWTRLFSHALLLQGTTILCIMTSQVGVDRFPRRCFATVSYWCSSKLAIFRLKENVYLCHLTNILRMYCDYFLHLYQKSTFSKMSTPQCREINVMTFDAECHEICFVGRKTNVMTLM